MSAAYEIIVVKRKDGICRVEEFRVENDLDTVGRVIEELDAPDLVQDGVGGIVGLDIRQPQPAFLVS